MQRALWALDDIDTLIYGVASYYDRRNTNIAELVIFIHKCGNTDDICFHLQLLFDFDQIRWYFYEINYITVCCHFIFNMAL